MKKCKIEIRFQCSKLTIGCNFYAYIYKNDSEFQENAKSCHDKL